ncbi:MAG: SCP2 sterol-binding domain-containing protein [Spirochaetaceae bacterium]|nr:MAG: SCP2 sterol-binding domain-containing protein [Spirochaetaceae bacterium]
MLFGSAEWLEAFHQAINSSAAYAEAAKSWEGDFYFVLDPDETMEGSVYYYVDLWHGKSRKAFVVDNPSDIDPEFVISAPVRIWRRVIEKNLDPIQGLVTRQLQLKGNLGKVLRAVKAAKELVNCTTAVPTQFPE